MNVYKGRKLKSK